MTSGWSITLEAGGEAVDDIAALADQIAALVDLLEPMSAVASYAPTGDRVSATLSIEAATPEMHASTADAAPTWAESATATLEACRTFEKAREVVGLPEWPVVNVHTRTFAEHDHELAHPAYPELVGVAEIAELINVTRQRVSELRGRAGFPEPLADLRAGPVWVRANVDRFVAEWPRKPGRPRTASRPPEVDAAPKPARSKSRG